MHSSCCARLGGPSSHPGLAFWVVLRESAGGTCGGHTGGHSHVSIWVFLMNCRDWEDHWQVQPRDLCVWQPPSICSSLLSCPERDSKPCPVTVSSCRAGNSLQASARFQVGAHFPGEEAGANLDLATWVAPHWLCIQVGSLRSPHRPLSHLLPAPWLHLIVLHFQTFQACALWLSF